MVAKGALRIFTEDALAKVLALNSKQSAVWAKLFKLDPEKSDLPLIKRDSCRESVKITWWSERSSF